MTWKKYCIKSWVASKQVYVCQVVGVVIAEKEKKAVGGSAWGGLIGKEDIQALCKMNGHRNTELENEKVCIADSTASWKWIL